MKLLLSCLSCGLLLVAAFACNRKTAPVPEEVPAEVAVEPETTPVDTVGQVEPEEEPELIARIRKTGCFGNCPMFHIELYDNGKVIYHGERHVDLIGEYHGMVTREVIDDIFEKAEFIGFFGLADVYPEDEKMLISDLPNTYTTLIRDGVKKRVRNNNGAPRGLEDFERYLVRTLGEIELSPPEAAQE